MNRFPNKEHKVFLELLQRVSSFTIKQIFAEIHSNALLLTKDPVDFYSTSILNTGWRIFNIEDEFYRLNLDFNRWRITDINKDFKVRSPFLPFSLLPSFHSRCLSFLPSLSPFLSLTAIFSLPFLPPSPTGILIFPLSNDLLSHAALHFPSFLISKILLVPTPLFYSPSSIIPLSPLPSVRLYKRVPLVNIILLETVRSAKVIPSLRKFFLFNYFTCDILLPFWIENNDLN